jgi:predicted phosphoribosyltransferase
MRKIPHPVERKILQPLVDSDHEVMMSFQDIIEKSWIDNKEVDGIEVLIKSWLDDLQEMYDKAERVDDLESNLYYIDNLVDDAENSLSEIRGYTNV